MTTDVKTHFNNWAPILDFLHDCADRAGMDETHPFIDDLGRKALEHGVYAPAPGDHWFAGLAADLYFMAKENYLLSLESQGIDFDPDEVALTQEAVDAYVEDMRDTYL
jgi:hypothetical protein